MIAPAKILSSCASSRLWLTQYRSPPSPDLISGRVISRVARRHCCVYLSRWCSKGTLKDWKSVVVAACKLSPNASPMTNSGSFARSIRPVTAILPSSARSKRQSSFRLSSRSCQPSEAPTYPQEVSTNPVFSAHRKISPALPCGKDRFARYPEAASGIAPSAAFQMGREQRVYFQPIRPFSSRFHAHMQEHARLMRIRYYLFCKPIAAFSIRALDVIAERMFLNVRNRARPGRASLHERTFPHP